PRLSFFSRQPEWTVEGRYKLPTAVRPVKALLFQVTVLGTPAEEDTGGKVSLMDAGAFADIDLVLMAHQAQQDASSAVTVRYYGKAFRTSAYQWEGVNALDAAVLHGEKRCIKNNLKPDIIPAYTELSFYMRTMMDEELSDLRAAAEACFRVHISYPSPAYCTILPNANLGKLYEDNAKALGIHFSEPTGSTDIGNVSHALRGIHPFLHVGTDVLNHAEEHVAAVGSAQYFTPRTAKSLAMTAVDVLCSPALLRQVIEDFRLAQLSAEKSSKGSDTALTAP
uniref:Peptidase M20 domain containing 2 n=1 Tax=Mola mola TaxID=94237 RepID=A0A3Q3W9P0_MOLML